MKSVFTLVMSMVVGGAWAEEAKAPPGSRYCTAAPMSATGADLAAGLKKCRVGDVVIINRRGLFAVATRCDFSKSIVAVGDDVICVLAAERTNEDNKTA